MSNAVDSVLARVRSTRRATVELVAGLADDDLVPQSMPDASPAKWHLAHSTWFFERFVLRKLGLDAVHPQYDYFFNSYYESVGARHPRGKRGLLTRPTVREVFAYRQAVDARLADMGERLAPYVDGLELGIQHEQQHQELLVTDLKHLFSENALFPAYRTRVSGAPPPMKADPLRWIDNAGGVASIGAKALADSGFSFDNERPRHKVYNAPFSIASRMTTAGEFQAFIADGGYRRSDLWLSEGWSWVQAEGRTAPLYWNARGDELFSLHGLRQVDPEEPVTHVSYYEADAYARWAGARLSTEAEWEVSAEETPGEGAFADDPRHHPAPARNSQFLGDAWEWTQSAYSPYPGFQPLEGAFGEYNGKFMVSQMILRGGSCATPRGHARITYRNFFPPNTQWQFSGIRLARDA